MLLMLLTFYTTYKAISASPLGNEGDIIAFLGYGISSLLLNTIRDKQRNEK